MPSPQGPLLPRRRLGAELRRLRGDRTLDEVAGRDSDLYVQVQPAGERARCSTASRHPRPDQLLRGRPQYIRTHPAGGPRTRRQQAWWKEYSDVIPESVDVFLRLRVRRFGHPDLLRNWSLPGLLQTEAYATRLLAAILPLRHVGADREARAASGCAGSRSCSSTNRRRNPAPGRHRRGRGTASARAWELRGEARAQLDSPARDLAPQQCLHPHPAARRRLPCRRHGHFHRLSVLR